MTTALAMGLAVACATLTPSHETRPAASDTLTRPVAKPLLLADFAGTAASPAVRQVANWVVDSADNRGLDFLIVDKREAKVFVFSPSGKLRGSSPVLLGAAAGDDSVPGIGNRPIKNVRPQERTTPAGRFLGEPGVNAHGEDIVWVDYDTAVSMHRLRMVDAAERRQERLSSPQSDDNRISYGCINVPPAFYNGYVRPIFAKGRGVFYVLPEIKSVHQVFGSYDVAEAANRQPKERFGR